MGFMHECKTIEGQLCFSNFFYKRHEETAREQPFLDPIGVIIDVDQEMTICHFTANRYCFNPVCGRPMKRPHDYN